MPMLVPLLRIKERVCICPVLPQALKRILHLSYLIFHFVVWNIKTAGLKLEEGKSLSSYLLNLHWAQTYVTSLSFGTWEVQGCTAHMAPERTGSEKLKVAISNQTIRPVICLLCAAPVLCAAVTDQGWVFSTQHSRRIRRFDNISARPCSPFLAS